MRVFLLMLLFLCTCLAALCQDELSNHKKYWFYKSRLNNDFIKVGTGSQGFSIPFLRRSGDEIGPMTVVNDILTAGDASAQLGIYLAVLATEYKLLHNNQQNGYSGPKGPLSC